MSTNTLEVYAVKHKDLDVRMKSRSGGIFTAVSDWVLEQGGTVYGCILTEDFKAVHVRAASKEERDAMRGSKYIQSEMGTCFRAVRQDLEDGRNVLFSGTSCQIAGLQGFLQRDYENLICMDILCHAVPSPLIWESYVKWQEKEHGKKCVSVDFRNKKDWGWAAHIETLTMEDGEQVNSRVFKRLFFHHCILRPSCHKCPYKSIEHPGDLTIGDYWKIDQAAPGFSDNKGVSLVLVNNEKGRRIFEKVKDAVEYRKCRIEDSMQGPLIKPYEQPEMREEFWEDYYRLSFDELLDKYIEKAGRTPKKKKAAAKPAVKPKNLKQEEKRQEAAESAKQPESKPPAPSGSKSVPLYKKVYRRCKKVFKGIIKG